MRLTDLKQGDTIKNGKTTWIDGYLFLDKTKGLTGIMELYRFRHQEPPERVEEKGELFLVD